MPLIDIPTIGVVEFPDSMSSADIEKAIKENILPPKTSAAGYVRETLKAIPRGAVRGLETAGLGLAALLPEETEKAAREKIQSVAERLAPSVAPGYEEAIPTKLGEAVGAIGSLLIPGLGVGRAAGALGAGAAGVRAAQLGTAGTLAPAMGAGEARKRAITEGATPEQVRTSTQFGAVVGLSELAPIERMFRGLGSTLTGGLIERVKRAAVTGGLEGAQEAAAQVAQNLIAQQIYKPSQELLESAGESGAYGAGAGAIVQFLLDAATGRRAPPAAALAPTPATEQLALPAPPELKLLPAPTGEPFTPVAAPDGSVFTRREDYERYLAEQAEAPPVTTEAPPVTTEAPPVTTEAPPVTTEAPPVTTEAAPEFVVNDDVLRGLGFKAAHTRKAFLKALDGVDVATPEGYAAFEDAMNKTRAKIDEPLVTDFMSRARKAFPPPPLQPTEGPRTRLMEPTIIGEQPAAPVSPEVELDFIRQRYEAGLPLTPAEQYRLREAQKAAPTPELALPEQPTPELALPGQPEAPTQPLEVVGPLERQVPPLQLTQTQIPQPTEPTYPSAPMPAFVTDDALENMGLSARKDKAAVQLRKELLAKDLNDPADAQAVRDSLRAYRDRTMTPKATREKIDAYLRAIPEQQEIDFERRDQLGQPPSEPSVAQPVPRERARRPSPAAAGRPDVDVPSGVTEERPAREEPQPVALETPQEAPKAEEWTPARQWEEYSPSSPKYSELTQEARKRWREEVTARPLENRTTDDHADFLALAKTLQEERVSVAPTPSTPSLTPPAPPSRTDMGDPLSEEAKTVQSAIEGKSVTQAARWLAQNAPDADYRLIASRVAAQLEGLQEAGLKLNLKIARLGDRVPSALTGSRGITHSQFAKDVGTMTIWLNGADVTGKVGTSYETLLHELIHAATMSAIRLGNLKKFQGSALTNDVQDLYAVTNAVVQYFNTRAKADKTSLTPFERRIFERTVNAARNPDEVLAWALTNRDMQQWLETIPYKGKSLWARFVEAIRNFLGLPARADTALAEVLRIGDKLLDVPPKEIAALAGRVGIALQVQEVRAQVASTGNTTLDQLNQQRIDQVTREGDRPFMERLQESLSKPSKLKEFAKKFAVNIVDNQYVAKRILSEAGQTEPVFHMAFASRAADIAATSLMTGPIQLRTLGGGRGVQTFGVTQGTSMKDVYDSIEEIANSLQSGSIEQRFAAASAMFDNYAIAERFNSLPAAEKAKFKIAADVFTAAREAKRLYSPQLRKALDDWTTYKNALLDANLAAGRFSAQDIAAWKQAADYVPWHRILDDAKHGYETKSSARAFFSSSLQATGQMKELLGGDTDQRPIGSVLQNMQGLAFWLSTSAIKNHAAVKVADVLGSPAFGGKQVGSKTAPGADKNKVIKVYKNGAETFYELDDPLAAYAFMPIIEETGPILDFLGKATQFVRKGTTMMPGFVVNQLFQDSQRVLLYSGVDNPYRAGSSVVSKFVGALRNDPLTQELNKYGLQGQVDYIFSGRFGEKSRAAKQLAPMDPGVRKGVNYLVEKLDQFSHASDMAQREAVYTQTMRETGGDEALALFRAIEIINFQNRGASQISSILRKSIPFFNAYVQGMNVTYRAMTKEGITAKDRQAALRQFYSTAAKVAAFSLLYAMFVSDDEEYQQMSPNEQMRGWLLPGSREKMKELTGVDIGQNLKIPVPMDAAGLLAKGLPELLYNYIATEGTASEMDNRKLLRAVRDGVVNAVAPSTPIPQAVKPSLELAVNYSFFTGRPIIGKGQEGKRPFQQYTETTSELAKAIGEATNTSPIKLDYFIRGTLGMFGGTLLYYGSSAYGSASKVEVPDTRLSDNPQLRAFFSGRAGSGLREDYYDLREKIDEVNRTVNDLMQRRPDKLQDFLEENKELYALAKSGFTGKMDEWIGKFRKARQAILASDLPAEEKRARLTELDKQEVAMFAQASLPQLRKYAGM